MTCQAASRADLHVCTMPFGYSAPKSFVKLFNEAVLFGSSRASAIDFFARLLRKTRVTCGRCDEGMDITLWSQTEIRQLYVMARRCGYGQLKERIHRDYDEKRPTCPACGLTAHLAHICLPLFDDWPLPI